jgi:hypothetical protein
MSREYGDLTIEMRALRNRLGAFREGAVYHSRVPSCCGYEHFECKMSEHYAVRADGGVPSDQMNPIKGQLNLRKEHGAASQWELFAWCQHRRGGRVSCEARLSAEVPKSAIIWAIPPLPLRSH